MSDFEEYSYCGVSKLMQNQLIYQDILHNFHALKFLNQFLS